MGVQSQGEFAGGLANGHSTVATGGMGTLMVETGLPTLNIIDAIWINANPPPSAFAGPDTPYSHATRVNVLLAGTDPVALDYWAAKHILVQAATLIGYGDTHSVDPDNTDRTGVFNEAFGVWLNLTKNEILAGGSNVTTDEQRINVYIKSGGTPPEIGAPSQVPSRDAVDLGDTVTVSVNVTDSDDGVKNATLFYLINNSSTWESQIMNFNSSTNLYEASIPGQEAGTWVSYKIIAYDNAGNTATRNGFEPDCTYLVIPENILMILLLPLLSLTALIFRKTLKHLHKPRVSPQMSLLSSILAIKTVIIFQTREQ